MSMFRFNAEWNESLPGQPELVNGDGWGWGLLGVILLLPFFIIGLLAWKFSKFVYQYPLPVSIGYFIVSVVIGLILFRRFHGAKKILGILCAVITLLPLYFVEGWYALPKILNDRGIISSIEWIWRTGLTFGITFFLFAIYGHMKRVGVQLILSVLFCLCTAGIVYLVR